MYWEIVISTVAVSWFELQQHQQRWRCVAESEQSAHE